MGCRGRKHTRGKARTQLRAAALAGWHTSWSCCSLALDVTSPPRPCGTSPLALSPPMPPHGLTKKPNPIWGQVKKKPIFKFHVFHSPHTFSHASGTTIGSISSNSERDQ